VVSITNPELAQIRDSFLSMQDESRVFYSIQEI
jgi:hypothetical protein